MQSDCNLIKENLKAAAERILGEVRKMPQGEGSQHLIAIDGRCASGKTTLAACIQELSGCNVIHMDHFFLRPEQRTRERMEEAGGNVDRERFLQKALLLLRQGEDVTYRRYDCHEQRFAEEITLRHCPLTVIEGTYSCHPSLAGYYDCRVFMSVDREEQMRRILVRNGITGAEAFRERWIPLEERYFSVCRVEECCEIRI